jgi:hypothetical protein
MGEEVIMKCKLCGIEEYETGTPVSKDTEEHTDLRECIKQLRILLTETLLLLRTKEEKK